MPVKGVGVQVPPPTPPELTVPRRDQMTSEPHGPGVGRHRLPVGTAVGVD